MCRWFGFTLRCFTSGVAMTPIAAILASPIDRVIAMPSALPEPSATGSQTREGPCSSLGREMSVSERNDMKKNLPTSAAALAPPHRRRTRAVQRTAAVHC